MNEDFKVWMQMLAQVREARRRGVPLATLDARIQSFGIPGVRDVAGLYRLVEEVGAQRDAAAPDSRSPVRTRDLLRSGAQTMLFEFGDELAGLLAGGPAGAGQAVAAARGMPAAAPDYVRTRDAVRYEDERFGREHPTADLLARLYGGGALATVGGGAAVGALPTVLSRVGAAIIGGTGYGAAAGAGAAEDVAAMPDAMRRGGTVGAGMGAAMALGGEMLPPLLGAAREVGRFARADRLLDGLAPQRAARIAAERTARLSRAREGFTDELRSLAGLERTGVDAARQTAQRVREAASRRHFAPLDEQFAAMPVSPEMQALLQQPRVARVWRRIRADMPAAHGPASGPGLQHYQALRQKLMDDASALARRGRGNAAREAREAANTLTARLEVEVPGYAAANAAYRQAATVGRALDEGLSARTRGLSARSVEQELSALRQQAGPHADAAARAYRQGLADDASRYLAEQGGSPTAFDRVTRLLEPAFPDRNAFRTWLRNARTAQAEPLPLSGLRPRIAGGGPPGMIPPLVGGIESDPGRQAAVDDVIANEIELPASREAWQSGLASMANLDDPRASEGKNVMMLELLASLGIIPGALQGARDVTRDVRSGETGPVRTGLAALAAVPLFGVGGRALGRIGRLLDDARYPALAAIRLRDGRLLTGMSHPEITFRAPELVQGLTDDAAGFVDARGVVRAGEAVPSNAWMSREDAYRAQAALHGWDDASGAGITTEDLISGGGLTMRHEHELAEMNRLRAERNLPPLARSEFVAGRPELAAGLDVAPPADEDTLTRAFVDAMQQGGATLEPSTARPATRGFSVADPDLTEPLPAATPEAVRDFIRRHQRELAQPGAHLGGWVDPSGAGEINVSHIVDSADEAVRLGGARNQHSAWDIVAGREVPIPDSARRAAPNEAVREVARRYAERTGFSLHHEPVAEVDPDFHRRIARAYEEMPSAPDDPETRAAYEALIRETDAQYQAIIDAGYTVEPVQTDPYRSSKEMMRDLRDHRRLRVYAAEADHPIMTPEQTVRFRAVHDFFGHAQEGRQFGAKGEEGAFRIHSAMFSPEARRAMATETRGQNSWVNFGPHSGRPPAERPFAPQKAGLLPPEFSEPTYTAASDPRYNAAPLAAGAGAGAAAGAQDDSDDGLNAAGMGTVVGLGMMGAVGRRGSETYSRIMRLLPDAERLAAAARAGGTRRFWYDDSADAIRALMGDDAPRFTSLLAATSPRRSVSRNLKQTADIWTAWERAGRPTTPEAIEELIRKYAPLPAHRNNVRRALMLGGDATLSGAKVEPFRHNVAGAPDPVTNDVIMAATGGIHQDLLGGTAVAALRDVVGNVDGPSVPYRAMRDRITETARLLGGDWTPARTQAAIWSWARPELHDAFRGAQRAAGSGLGEIPVESTEDLPDFARLLAGYTGLGGGSTTLLPAPRPAGAEEFDPALLQSLLENIRNAAAGRYRMAPTPRAPRPASP